MITTCKPAAGFSIDQLNDIKLMSLREAEGLIDRDLRYRSYGNEGDLHQMRTEMAIDAAELALSATRQINKYFGRR